MKNIIINIVLVLSLSISLCAQDMTNVLAVRKLERSQKNTKNLSQVYDDKGFMRYVVQNNNEEEDEMDVVVLRKIANSYRMNADYENAENWYVKFVNQNSIQEDILHYAQTLQANGRCNDAVRWFSVYKSKVGSNNQTDFDFISNCTELENFTNHSKVDLMNMSSLNTEGLDFSPCVTNEGIYLTSNRGARNAYSDSWTNSNFTDIYFVSNENLNSEAPTLARGDLNNKHHDGVVCFTKDQNTMYFTRNNENAKQDQVLNLKIYECSTDNSNWSKPKELPFNSDDFSTAHPTLSKDGSTMYFSSNRPGGYGGMDIYMSKNIKGNWSTPVNLGPIVNSEGNEIFPFINNEEHLIYASNGHAGYGGLDLFAAKANNNNWNERENCGKPFNSIKDDFGFYMNDENKQGYISSSRPGGKGKDDIYSFSSNEVVDFFGKATVNRTICFVEKGSNKKLSEVNIDLKNTSNKTFGLSFESDEKGFFTHEMLLNSRYDIEVSKEGYKNVKTSIDPKAISSTENECHIIEMDKLKTANLNGTVLEEGNNQALANAKVEIKNSCTSKSTKVLSDVNGKFSIPLDCNCNYEVIANKTSFSTDTEKFKISNNCYTNKNVKLKLRAHKIVKAPVVTNRLIGTKTISEGMVIELKNIYYDYNKANIRKDATVDLEHLAELMNQYPSMNVELGSHTDARGTDSYNMDLSSKRAAAARQYLISKGISSSRLTSRGYGETRLLNECANGVECDDAAHQQNRRTEVKVTKFNNNDIEIKYRN